ncbi:hypothetical protein FACS189472_08500 [Alphaproteobacteria bacterium]|nr:hypothetical protein FACS189472_08500 [Alphaproteobacteria bacterium]
MSSYTYLSTATELHNLKLALLRQAEGNDSQMLEYLDRKIDSETERIERDVNTKISTSTVSSLNNIVGNVNLVSEGIIDLTKNDSQRRITITSTIDPVQKLNGMKGLADIDVNEPLTLSEIPANNKILIGLGNITKVDSLNDYTGAVSISSTDNSVSINKTIYSNKQYINLSVDNVELISHSKGTATQTINGSETVSTNLTVNGDTTMNGDATVNGSLVVENISTSATPKLTIGTGTAALAGEVRINSSLNCEEVSTNFQSYHKSSSNSFYYQMEDRNSGAIDNQITIDTSRTFLNNRSLIQIGDAHFPEDELPNVQINRKELTIWGDSTVNGSETITGDLIVNKIQTESQPQLTIGTGNEAAAGEVLINGNLTVENDTLINGELTVENNVQMNGELRVGGVCNFQNGITIGSGNLTIGSGDLTIGSTTITDSQLQALLAMIP